MSYLDYKQIAGQFPGGSIPDDRSEKNEVLKPINTDALEVDLNTVLQDALDGNINIIHKTKSLPTSSCSVTYSFNPNTLRTELSIKTNNSAVAKTTFQYDRILRVWKLADVIVKPEFNGMGVGTALVRVFENYAKSASPEITEVSMNIRRLTVLVLAANEGYVPDDYNLRVLETGLSPDNVALDHKSHILKGNGRLTANLLKKLNSTPEITAERENFKAFLLKMAGLEQEEPAA